MSGSLKPATLNKSNHDQGVNVSHLSGVPKTLVSDDAPLQLHGGGAAPCALNKDILRPPKIEDIVAINQIEDSSFGHFAPCHPNRRYSVTKQKSGGQRLGDFQIEENLNSCIFSQKFCFPEII